MSRHRTTVVPLPNPFGERRCLGFGEGDAGWLGGIAEGRIVRQYVCIAEPAVHERLLELNSAGAMSSLPLLGRPTCMALPATLGNGAATSAGCVGNRVYTGLGEDELYVTLRGSDLDGIAGEIDRMMSANEALRAYHDERRVALTK